MNLFADEGVEKQIVARLRQDGQRFVLHVAQIQPGVPDEEVLNEANKQNALLIASNKDFGELVYRQHLVNNGVVLLRFMGLTATLKASLVSAAIQEHGEEMQKDAFTVLSPGMVRIRPRSTATEP